MRRLISAFTAVVILACITHSAEPPKRLLLITHAGGFMHDSLLVAEQVLTKIGPPHGLDVTCFRFTADPATTNLAEYSERFQTLMGEPVTPRQSGRVNAETLKNFDAVIFLTTSTWEKRTGSHPTHAIRTHRSHRLAEERRCVCRDSLLQRHFA